MKLNKFQSGGTFIDTRSDTTRKGYHEGYTPWGVGNGPAGQGLSALIDYTLNYNPKLDEGSQYYDPTYTPPITGITPSAGLSSKSFLKLLRSNPKFNGISGIANPIRNESELAAAQDFAAEFGGIKPNTLQIPRGRTPRYYKEIGEINYPRNKFNTRPLEVKEDKAMGLSKRVKKKSKFAEALSDGDSRHVNSGQNRYTNAQRRLATKQARENRATAPEIERLLKRQAKAKFKGTDTRQIDKELRDFLDLYISKYGTYKLGGTIVEKFKKGHKIHIKPENKGKFTDYCGGKVTQECIRRGKSSPNPTIRKRATFAQNSKRWSKKHRNGGQITQQLKTNRLFNNLVNDV